jgi:hypothetical protein
MAPFGAIFILVYHPSLDGFVHTPLGTSHTKPRLLDGAARQLDRSVPLSTTSTHAA